MIYPIASRSAIHSPDFMMEVEAVAVVGAGEETP